MPALREFILAQGASKNVTYQEWDKIWSINKKLIDPICPRHTAVKAQAKVLLTLTDVSATDYVTVDRHNKNPGAGKKVTERSPVRLRLWRHPPFCGPTELCASFCPSPFGCLCVSLET